MVNHTLVRERSVNGSLNRCCKGILVAKPTLPTRLTFQSVLQLQAAISSQICSPNTCNRVVGSSFLMFHFWLAQIVSSQAQTVINDAGKLKSRTVDVRRKVYLSTLNLPFQKKYAFWWPIPCHVDPQILLPFEGFWRTEKTAVPSKPSKRVP